MPDPDTEWAALLHRLCGLDKASIPTLHCLSQSNTVNPPALGEDLAACFGTTAEVLWHAGGRSMPGKTWWKDSKGFPDRATGRSEYVAGMHG